MSITDRITTLSSELDAEVKKYNELAQQIGNAQQELAKMQQMIISKQYAIEELNKFAIQEPDNALVS